MNKVTNDFKSTEHNPVTLIYLFRDFESKSIVLIDVPLWNEKGKVSKQLFNKLKVFIKEKFDCRILWKQKMSDSFSL